jgi:hypothetical protein
MRLLRRLLLLALPLLCLTPCKAQQDIYGGLTSLKCATATGYFHVEKIGTRWWFCTPLGNAFFMQGVYVVDYGQNAGYEAKVKKKYGGTVAWAVPTLQRLKSWGFNSLNLYADAAVIPFATDKSYPVDSHGLHSIPVKLPFVMQIRPAMYSMENPTLTINYKPQKLLPPGHEVKDMEAGWSRNYTGYRPSYGVADYFDGNMQTWLDSFLMNATPNLHNSPYANYVMGFTFDDGDEMYGFGAGPDFQTVPAGHNNPNLSWLVATMTPIQTALKLYPTVYLDRTVYTKKAWHDYLVFKYGEIQALNTAWGSNYTTFDSSGRNIIGEAVAEGDGRTTNFVHLLTTRTSTPYTVQILLNDTPIAGDLGNGQLYGPTLTGSIVPHAPGNSSLALFFHTPPAAGSKITTNYVFDGWGVGTGLMDEDGREAHQVWLGSDFVALSNSNLNVKADMNAFLYQTATRYLGMCKNEIKKVFPHYLTFGPDGLGGWQAPAAAPVLRAAAATLDVMIGGVGIALSSPYQPKLDFVEQYLGDKPLMTGSYLRANPDSPFSAYSSSLDFPNQATRGTAYHYEMLLFRTAAYSKTGSHPFVGLSWFAFTDNKAQETNWGLVTLLDNAYDGNEAVPATVRCSAPLQMYPCGGEAKSYGDVMTSVKAANALWQK